ncbi:MAG: ATP-binding cassette domain-containing protein, partial [Dongiaceae bacterium]
MSPAGPVDAGTLLTVRDLKVHFRIGGGFLSRKPRAVVKAVDGVNFTLKAGETLGLVGESGCGKSTLGRAVLRLLSNAEGHVVWLGQNLAELQDEAMRLKRREMQIIFQDPLASLNPRMTAGEIIAEPVRTFEPGLASAEVKRRVQEMMAKVGLLP